MHECVYMYIFLKGAPQNNHKNGNKDTKNGNQRNVQGNGSGNHENEHSGNSNQLQNNCVEKVKGKMRHHLTDDEIAAICHMHDVWMHRTHSRSIYKL